MEQQRPYFRHNFVAEEEEKVWVSFYRNAHDPHLAAELIAHMDKDADSRIRYPGLYLRCKQSLRRNREREARARRTANALRSMLRFIVLTPFSVLVSLLRQLRAGARFSSHVILDVCDGAVTAAPSARPRATRHAPVDSTAPTAASPHAVDPAPPAASADAARSA